MKHQITIGNRKLVAETSGSGNPTVVLEVGSTQAGTKSMGWWPIRDSLAKDTCVLMYDRGGTGDSDPAPIPRPISEFTQDLHAVLHGARVGKPYLLVGGSFGGLIVTHYASLYPDEIAGVVLVDSTHPEHNLRTLQLLPPFTPGESQALTHFREALWQETYAPLSTDEQEGLDFPASTIQMRAAWDMGNIPLSVLTAGQDEWEAGFPPDVAAPYEELWLVLQRELAGRSSQGTNLIVPDSGHCMHDENPGAILEAVRAILREFKEGNHDER